MNLQLFFKQLVSSGFVTSQTVIYFSGDESDYPLLFFSLVLQRLKKEGIHVQTIDLTQDSVVSVTSRLRTSFLGQQTFFWLKNLGGLDDAKRTHWLTFLREYNGPNIVTLFISNQVQPHLKSNHLIVDVPALVEQKEFNSFASFFNIPMPAATASLVAQIYKEYDKISLDAGCLLMHYMQALGVSNEQFVNQWVHKILRSDKSLFTLSALLFARKSKLFFELWTLISCEYGGVFWTAYWSEQLWRSYNFVYLMHNNQPIQAKKIAVRLPFTFIQRDFKLHTLQQLKDAHDQIYEIDFALKNGGSAQRLDLFFSQFFT